MKTFFADTSYLIALVNPKDRLHQRVMALSDEVDSARVVTSEMVLTELLNHLADGGMQMRQVVVELVQEFHHDPVVSVIPQSSSQFREALALYLNRRDKTWSHTDCASFHIMEREGITEALTHDRHFEQSGFRALLRD